MTAKQKLIDNFYLKTFFIGWSLCCAVWSFMIFQFWWGNHDWEYLKDGVFIASGFFEARYSQHLPTVLFFDGHILPVIAFISAMALLMILAVLVVNYLEIPKSMRNYLFVMLFVGLNPYNFVLFYYVHYMTALAFWGAVGVGFLCVVERKKCWYNFLFGAFLFFLILGSYPPNVALLLVLFLAKRLKKYCDGQENFVQICKSGIYFCFQLLLGYCGFKFVFEYLKTMQFINNGMYNINFRPAGGDFLSHYTRVDEIFITIVSSVYFFRK